MVSLQSIDHLVFSSKQFQSCNKSLFNQACSGPSWENISPWSFLYGPSADILSVQPSCLVNKIYIFQNVEALCAILAQEDRWRWRWYSRAIKMGYLNFYFITAKFKLPLMLLLLGLSLFIFIEHHHFMIFQAVFRARLHCEFQPGLKFHPG